MTCTLNVLVSEMKTPIKRLALIFKFFLTNYYYLIIIKKTITYCAIILISYSPKTYIYLLPFLSKTF